MFGPGVRKQPEVTNRKSPRELVNMLDQDVDAAGGEEVFGALRPFDDADPLGFEEFFVSDVGQFLELAQAIQVDVV